MMANELHYCAARADDLQPKERQKDIPVSNAFIYLLSFCGLVYLGGMNESTENSTENHWLTEHASLESGSERYDADTMTNANESLEASAEPRMKALPLVLFLLTLLSTFWVGVCEWSPLEPFSIAWSQGNLLVVRKLLIANWDIGLMYMGAVILILFLHEMGHFVGTLIYRVPASFPFFLPFPINPIGTLGAVIGMQGTAANRQR